MKVPYPPPPYPPKGPYELMAVSRFRIFAHISGDLVFKASAFGVSWCERELHGSVPELVGAVSREQTY